MQTIAIIGGGASGLAAAFELSKYPEHFFIQVFDRNNKIAKKVAATGNGKCNLSNANITIDRYQGDIDSLFERVKAFDIKKFTNELGFMIRQTNELFYPYSEQARTVTSAFERWMEDKGVHLVLNTCITSVKYQNQMYYLYDETGKMFKAHQVIFACGGKASPVFGSDGLGFDILEHLGLKSTPLLPSLVQMKTKPALKKLKGCRFHGVFTLTKHNQKVASYQGEALLTEDGISGISVMQLSRFLNEEQGYVLHCHLVNELSKEDLKVYYENHKDDSNLYLGVVQEKLAEYFNGRTTKSFEDFYQRLSDFQFEIIGTRGFESAQVTKGGIPLTLLNEHLMSKKYPGLYVCGEMLNVDGDCGGFNLHFAFASAMIVSKDIIAKVHF